MMTTQKTNSQGIMMKYGLYLGLTNIAISVLMYVLGVQTSGKPLLATLLGIASFVLMVLIIVLAIREYKMSNAGYLSLGQALKTGIGVALIGGVIAVLYNLVFVTYIEPDYVTKVIDAQMRQTIEQNPQLTQQQLDMGREMAEKMSKPMISSSMSIVFSLFTGLIVSLIAGAVMQKKSPEEMYN